MSMVPPKKEFVIRHVIEDVSKMEKNQEFNVEEEHFGIPWSLVFGVRSGSFQIHLQCLKSMDSRWHIETDTYLKVLSSNGSIAIIKERCIFKNNQYGRWGWYDFMPVEVFHQSFVVDGKVTIEAQVIIEEMEGCGKTEKLRRFDESVKEFSDVVLVVQERKFYLLKMFLALQSSYFKGLLLGNFEESKKEEVTLNDIDPDDFQDFLEVIHGESAVDDSTVDGILYLADMYDAPTALRRCEEFLMEKSKLEMKKKLQLSLRYRLQALKTKCLSEINTAAEIQSIMSAQIPEMDLETSQVLLQKKTDQVSNSENDGLGGDDSISWRKVIARIALTFFTLLSCYLVILTLLFGYFLIF